MKKLLKSVIYRSVNSTQKHYSPKTWSTTTACKKKKNAERKNVDTQSKHSLYVMWELKKHTTKMYQPKVEVLKHKKLLI